MSFWRTLAKFAPLAALAIPGVGPGVGMALKGAGVGAALKGAGKFLGSPGGAAATSLAGTLIGAGMQNRGANRATDIASRANEDSLAWLKQQDAMDRAEYEKERARAWAFEEEDRRYGLEDRAHKYKREAEREDRLAPFRNGAERGYQTLSGLLFNPGASLPQARPASGATSRRLSDLVLPTSRTMPVGRSGGVFTSAGGPVSADRYDPSKRPDIYGGWDRRQRDADLAKWVRS